MRAIIISAGKGTRLLGLTEATPKCLVEVDGRAIVDRQFDALAAAGIDEAIVVGGFHIDQIVAHLARGTHAIASTVVLNPFWNVAGAIGSVWAARAALDAPFLLVNGDTLFDPAIARAALDHREGVALVVEPLASAALDDMLVEVDGARIRDVAKTLPPERATHRSLGMIVSAGGDAYREALTHVIGGEGGVHAYHHDVVARLARDGGASALIAPEAAHWQEIDRPEDIAAWLRDHPGRDG